MTCSIDLRRRVLRAVEEGASHTEAARRFQVGRASIARWQRQLEPQKPGPKTARAIDMSALLAHVQQYPDAYLSERAEAFGVSTVGIWKALRRLGITKKNVDVSPEMYT